MLPISQFSLSQKICAVAVGKTDDTIVHCGLLYTKEVELDKKYFFLHLGDPAHLYNEAEFTNGGIEGYTISRNGFVWLPFEGTPNPILNLICTKCIVVAKKNKALPYGIFHSEETYFDANGKLILGSDSTGLTCTTFLKAILKGCGLDVLDEDEWPDERESDVVWLNNMIKTYESIIGSFQRQLIEINSALKKSLQFEQKIAFETKKTDLIRKIDWYSKTLNDFKEGVDVVLKRYRPEEFSACSYEPILRFPIKFEYKDGQKGAGTLGEELLKKLPVFKI